jgi:hypothetical protein
MTTPKMYTVYLQEGIYEVEAAVERLREEIQRLTEERDILINGNLEIYLKLKQGDF